MIHENLSDIRTAEQYDLCGTVADTLHVLERTVDRIDFTPDESIFLRHHKILEDEVYDARYKPSKIWKANAKRLGFDFVVGAYCKEAGHRLRTRAGHCIQCDTSKIAYAIRHRTPGYVYVAASPSGHLYKIGSTLNLDQREKLLRYDQYGGFRDWIIIKSIHVEQRGAAEGLILRILAHARIESEYIKDGNKQLGKELIRCSLEEIVNEFDSITEHYKPSRKWEHHLVKDFDY